MKNIELTENHKSKLLEMCKELFPEYKEIYFGIDEYDNNFNGFIYFAKNKLPCKNIIEIHWFEFCMTHLTNKIYELDDDSGNYSDYLEDILHNHPVNYLYEEFKKLK